MRCRGECTFPKAAAIVNIELGTAASAYMGTSLIRNSAYKGTSLIRNSHPPRTTIGAPPAPT